MSQTEENDAVDCERCHCCATEWVECWNGCENGSFDAYEDDPLWFSAGERELCGACRGAGGYRLCFGRCDEHGKHVAQPAEGAR